MATTASPTELPGFAQSYDAVFGAAVDAVATLSWEVTVAERDAGVIAGRTPKSFGSAGEKVTVRIYRPDLARQDSLVRVGFTSGSEQAVDWGKNGRNQAEFYARLGRLLGVSAQR